MSEITVLIPGGLGFIGSNFVRYMESKYPSYRLVVVDNGSLPGTDHNLRGTHAVYVHGDIRDKHGLRKIYERFRPTYVVNFAAESHNDRAILDPDCFYETNVVGTQYLLSCSRAAGVQTHVHISTIEVYGEQGEGVEYFTETSPLNAKTPYSSSKAGGDLAVRAFMKTYPDLHVCMTHCANNYGAWQYPEKFIPVAIASILQGEEIPLYGDGLQMRDWLHVLDHCRAIDLVLHQGKAGGIYDISARNEVTNLHIAKLLCDIMEVPHSRIKHVGDRPNHDRRYLIEPKKIETELGFKPIYDFMEGLKLTVNWYKENLEWWERIQQLNKNLRVDWEKTLTHA